MMSMAYRMPISSRSFEVKSITRFFFVLFLAFAGMLGASTVVDTTVGAQQPPPGVNTYGAEVINFQPGYYGTTCENPNNQGGTASSVLGPPDDPAGDGSGSATNRSTSLGFGGQVTIRFAGPARGDGNPNTPDVWVWETGSVAEHYRVRVSEDGVNWTTIGESNQQTHGSQGFNVDGHGFDENSRIWYIRVIDLRNEQPPQANCISGSDIDAVGVVTEAPYPAMELVKTSDIEDGDPVEVGDVIEYTFTVTNTGNMDLVNVSITDELEGISGITPPLADIPVGEEAVFTATYVVRQADVDAGQIVNVASVTGEPDPRCEACESPNPPPVENITNIPQNPAMTVTKEPSGEGPFALGDTVTYTFTVQNTGNVTLTDVTITDELPGLTWVVGPTFGTMEPGDLLEGSATYVITEADVLNGSVTNTAVGDGTPPESCEDCETDVTNPPPVTVITEDPNPAMTVTKEPSGEGPFALGDTVTYTFTVQNTGNVTLTDVTITDELPGLSWVTGPNLGTVIPGQTVFGEATYVITEADVLNGSVTNTAEGTGNPPVGCEDCETDVTNPPPVAVITEDPNPAMTVTKAPRSEGPFALGDTVIYTFSVQNTGNVTLTDVTITDELPGLSWVTGPNLGTVIPGQTVFGEATYVITEADVLAGSVTNTAIGNGNPPAECEDCETNVTNPPPVTVITEDPTPGLSLLKQANTEGPVSLGDPITYTFTVTNTGNVTLTDVTITDELPGLVWINGPNLGTITPGDSAVGEATYITTEADIIAGGITNSATAMGVPPGELPPPETPPSEVTVPGNDPETGLILVKEANTEGPVSVGDSITYTFTVTNIGNLPLADVTIIDELPGLEWVEGPNLGTLAPGASTTGSATYVTTQADINAGGVFNSAISTGTPPGELPPPMSPPSEVTVPGTSTASLNMVKSVSPDTTIDVGETLTYTFEVTNTGVTTVDNVTVTDPLPGLSEIDGPHGTSLEPGESATFTATYVVTELDGIAGMVMNTATASGTGSDGGELTSTDSVAIRACVVPESDDTEAEAPEATPPIENESEVNPPVTEEPATPPADEPPADEPPAEEPPADEPPAEEPPAEEPPAEEPEEPVVSLQNPERVLVSGFQQLADCEPLPVDPAPEQPGPSQPAPGAPSAPPVTSLPSTGQGGAADGFGLATTALITAGLGIVLAAGTIVIRRNRA